MMKEMEFLAGSEMGFLDFIGRLNEKDKIAIISHTDLDGLAAAKIANEAVGASFTKFIDYIDLNMRLVEDLRNRKFTKLLFLDIDFERIELLREMEKFAEILIIDHHLFRENLNSSRTNFLSSQGYCASYICYYLFSKVHNVSKYDWLAAAASLSEMCYSKNADWIMSVKEKYGDTFSIEEMTKLSKIYDRAYKLSLMCIYFRGNLNEAYNIIGEDIDDAGNLDNYAKDVQREIENSAARFEKEKKSFSNEKVYFWEFKPEFFVKSILINSLSMKYKDRVVIVLEDNGGYFEASARMPDGRVNVAELMKKLTSGFEGTSGGHISAAGATILSKDVQEFKERVRRL